MEEAAKAYRYSAVDRTGRRVSAVVHAPNTRAALRLLSADGLTPLQLREQAATDAPSGSGELKFSHRVLVLRQLALMVEAGVGLLEAVSTVAGGIASAKARAELEALADALKRGEPFAAALEANAPGYPFYVYAMARVGEATGQLGPVLRDAGEQMAYEDRLRRDVLNALTYPGFLAGAGLAAVVFIFTQVVPRFATMIGDNRDRMPILSRWILAVGEFSDAHLILVLGALVALGLGAVAAIASPAARLRLYEFGHRVPLLGTLLRAREIAAWARITAFALASGVGLMEAATLARQAAPPGAFREALAQFERDLRAGVEVDVSLGRHTRLTAMDLSLLRTGQRSGQLPRMFGFLADSYDGVLRDTLKRATALVEPIAIGVISILVGVVALSLVLALSSVYDQVF